jgi:hypothetical protein
LPTLWNHWPTRAQSTNAWSQQLTLAASCQSAMNSTPWPVDAPL